MSDYKVGRGRPPVHTRFKKGQSGNPRGRPRRSPSFRDTFDRHLRRKVTIREGDSVRTVPASEALVMALFNKAMKGHGPSQKIIHLLWSSGDEAVPDTHKLISDQRAFELMEEMMTRSGKTSRHRKKRRKGNVR